MITFVVLQGMLELMFRKYLTPEPKCLKKRIEEFSCLKRKPIHGKSKYYWIHSRVKWFSQNPNSWPTGTGSLRLLWPIRRKEIASVEYFLQQNSFHTIECLNKVLPSEVKHNKKWTGVYILCIGYRLELFFFLTKILVNIWLWSIRQTLTTTDASYMHVFGILWLIWLQRWF